jgi:hypothetical protein
VGVRLPPPAPFKFRAADGVGPVGPLWIRNIVYDTISG